KTIRLEQLAPGYRGMVEAIGTFETDPAATLAAMDKAMAIGATNDPEAVYLLGMMAALCKVPDRAVEAIARGVDSGFAPVISMETAPVLDIIRGRPEFTAALEKARQRQQIAMAIFQRGGGPELLGIAPE